MPPNPFPGERKLPPWTESQERRAGPLVKLMSVANTWLFRASGGRLGARFMHGAPVGLLTTTGRRSGQQRTTPLIYLADDERIVLVASKAGMSSHPVWFLNLEANGEVEFQTAKEPRKMQARRASPEEKAGYWPRLCEVYPDYDDYQARTERDIPVLILEPR
jgi:deazaflavin-dependent oxidoreductase (nitroreductase family)